MGDSDRLCNRRTVGALPRAPQPSRGIATLRSLLGGLLPGPRNLSCDGVDETCISFRLAKTLREINGGRDARVIGDAHEGRLSGYKPEHVSHASRALRQRLVDERVDHCIKSSLPTQDSARKRAGETAIGAGEFAKRAAALKRLIEVRAAAYKGQNIEGGAPRNEAWRAFGLGRVFHGARLSTPQAALSR